MENDNERKDNRILNLSNVAQLTTFAIAITVTFSLVRLYMYYLILLHVPIFQYIDVVDIVLLAPTGIYWALYVGSVEASNYVVQSNNFHKIEKIFYPIVLWSFIAFVV